jgi:hypothetical protein
VGKEERLKYLPSPKTTVRTKRKSKGRYLVKVYSRVDGKKKWVEKVWKKAISTHIAMSKKYCIEG